MNFLVYIINRLADLLVLLVIVHVIVSYFLDWYHPVRRFTGSIVEPLLAPIRRVIPPVGMLDFSPVVLIVLIRIVIVLIDNLLG